MRVRGRLAAWVLAIVLAGCVGVTASLWGPPPTGEAAPASKSGSGRPVDGGGSGGFFATHPATNERVQALRRTR